MAGAKGRSGGNRTPQTVSPSITQTEPPTKPDGLSEAAGRHWDNLMEMIPESVLVPIDGFELAILSNLFAQSDHLAKRLADDPDDDKANRLFLQTFKEIHRLSACFGLNPADRKRLNLGPDEGECDPFLEYLQSR